MALRYALNVVMSLMISTMHYNVEYKISANLKKKL